MNPIETVVAPLKSEAMDRAEQYAKEVVATVRKELKAAGNDLHICAPYPDHKVIFGRFEFINAARKYDLFQKLCTWRRSGIPAFEPCLADVDSNHVAKFIKDARKDAALQYDLFVEKLCTKIGAVTKAELAGNHVWSFSFLTVTKANGSKEVWKTQQIMNVSKLGKVFAQWPTRKVRILRLKNNVRIM